MPSGMTLSKDKGKVIFFNHFPSLLFKQGTSVARASVPSTAPSHISPPEDSPLPGTVVIFHRAQYHCCRTHFRHRTSNMDKLKFRKRFPAPSGLWWTIMYWLDRIQLFPPVWRSLHLWKGKHSVGRKIHSPSVSKFPMGCRLELLFYGVLQHQIPPWAQPTELSKPLWSAGCQCLHSLLKNLPSACWVHRRGLLAPRVPRVRICTESFPDALSLCDNWASAPGPGVTCPGFEGKMLLTREGTQNPGPTRAFSSSEISLLSPGVLMQTATEQSFTFAYKKAQSKKFLVWHGSHEAQQTAWLSLTYSLCFPDMFFFILSC